MFGLDTQAHAASERPERRDWLATPRPSLASLAFAAIVRDTRRAPLRPDQRFNCFPASPFCTVSWIFEGEIWLVDETGKLAAAPMPRLSLSGPFPRPLTSWNPGPVHAISISFYPDAWRELTGVPAADVWARVAPLDSVLAGERLDCFAELSGEPADADRAWRRLQDALDPMWRRLRPRDEWAPSIWVRDWTRSLLVRAAVSGPGGGVRQVQRRIKAWTGHSLRALDASTRVEALFAATHARDRAASLAEIAAEVGYADQSHMGREVKRVTGVSPARIRALVESDERFWCYRLLAERF